MSSDILAQVEPFAKKADELVDKGHLLRAAENYGRAAEAARALGADNLVALKMRLLQSSALGCYARTAPRATDADPCILAAHRAESIALLSGAVDALERRRAAGTLLEGKCAAVEEAWRASEIRRLTANSCSAVAAASFAPLTGYEDFMRSAVDALVVLACAREFAAECSYAQLQSFVQHVVRAAELMQQPRRHADVALNMEAKFTTMLRAAVAEAGAAGGVALASALQRLQRSGVLQARRIEDCIGKIAPGQRAIEAAVQNSLTPPGLRDCALDGCGAREAHPAHFKSCAACRTDAYCSKEHQVAGWSAHKKACKAARKAAAAEDDGAGPSGA